MALSSNDPSQVKIDVSEASILKKGRDDLVIEKIRNSFQVNPKKKLSCME